jgi:hypothetical protein
MYQQLPINYARGYIETTFRDIDGVWYESIPVFSSHRNSFDYCGGSLDMVYFDAQLARWIKLSISVPSWPYSGVH